MGIVLSAFRIMEKKIHFLFMIVWTIMMPITLMTDLKVSVPYVAAISVWALIASHAAAWAATRAGEKAEDVEKTVTEHNSYVHNAIHKLHIHHGIDK